MVVSEHQQCPEGLTKLQKTRVQHLWHWEQQEEEERSALEKKKVKSQVWHVKQRADGKDIDDPSAVPINMVFILP